MKLTIIERINEYGTSQKQSLTFPNLWDVELRLDAFPFKNNNSSKLLQVFFSFSVNLHIYSLSPCAIRSKLYGNCVNGIRCGCSCACFVFTMDISSIIITAEMINYIIILFIKWKELLAQRREEAEKEIIIQSLRAHAFVRHSKRERERWR